MDEKAIIEGHIYTVANSSVTIKRDNVDPYIERIRPGAFNKSIGVYGKVSLYFNHERPIAEIEDIEINEDDEGLFFRANIDDIEVISRCLFKQIKGCSFKYKALEELIKYGGVDKRTIEEMFLMEITISDREPCYPSCVDIIYLPEELKIKAYQYHVDDLSISMKGN